MLKGVGKTDFGDEAALAAARGDYAQAVQLHEQGIKQTSDPGKVVAHQGEIRRLKREAHQKYAETARRAPANANPMDLFETAVKACYFGCPDDIAKLCQSRRQEALDALARQVTEALSGKQYEAALQPRAAYARSPRRVDHADRRGSIPIKRKEASEIWCDVRPAKVMEGGHRFGRQGKGLP